MKYRYQFAFVTPDKKVIVSGNQGKIIELPTITLDNFEEIQQVSRKYFPNIYIRCKIVPEIPFIILDIKEKAEEITILCLTCVADTKQKYEIYGNNIDNHPYHYFDSVTRHFSHRDLTYETESNLESFVWPAIKNLIK